MRSMALPASSSRSVFTTGIAAPADASKLSATPCCSASAAKRTPCFARSALLAVTTGLPALSAASTAERAGSPAPPISSTKRSMSSDRASATGSENHSAFFSSKPRSFERERAQTATTSTGRPHLAVSISRSRPIWAIRAAPTVPRPATPTFSAGGMLFESAAGSERDDVVQLFGRCVQEAADIAGGLADALLVLDQRDAHEAFAALAEAGAGRDRDLGLFDEQLGELDRAHFAERLGDRGPREHRGARRRHLPAGA